MDTGRFLKVPGQSEAGMDKYTASIELSNACRRFYKARLEAAHSIKSRWERHANATCCGTDSSNDNARPTDDNGSSSCVPPTQRRQRNSIDEAMDKLRTAMTALMDQDLSLMKQLLTLNETIEELKWQRRYYYSSSSLPGSSTDLRNSDCSVSDTEMFDLEDDSLHTARASPLPAKASAPAASTSQPPLVLLTPPSSSCSSSHRKQGLVQGSGQVTAEHALCSGTKQGSVDCEVMVRVGDTSAVKAFHSEQDSFDSGFHEPSSEEDAAVSC